MLNSCEGIRTVSASQRLLVLFRNNILMTGYQNEAHRKPSRFCVEPCVANLDSRECKSGNNFFQIGPRFFVSSVVRK